MGFTGSTGSLESGCVIGKACASRVAAAACQQLTLSLSYDNAPPAFVKLLVLQGPKGARRQPDIEVR
jgi:hypothetical protein